MFLISIPSARANGLLKNENVREITSRTNFSVVEHVVRTVKVGVSGSDCDTF